MVSYSEQLLALSISRLTGLLAAYDPLTAACGKELTEEFRSLRKALEIAYHERAQVQKLKGGEQAAGASLDLDAARAEITSRLARLRRAAGSGGISAQTQ
ncbi:MAG: hypothetical protein LAT78_13425 [Roseinatronobacter sp.]|nr:hypothetical protein [Roseinatronobacter sp.]